MTHGPGDISSAATTARGRSQSVRAWSAEIGSVEAEGDVESIPLREGLTLILSRYGRGSRRSFQHLEPQDVCGIGFHLHGGARFDMDGVRFVTRPLDVWAGSGPRSSSSRFDLPSQGFRTVSLRFSVDWAAAFLDAHGVSSGALADTVAASRERVAATRLSSMDPVSVRLVEGVLATSVDQPLRALYLESAALALLSLQVLSVSPAGRATPVGNRSSQHRRLLRARTLLEEQLDAPPSIVSLARLVGINEFALKRGFREAFGTTVYGYVRRRRMERAAAGLRAGLSVGEAAVAVGYECPRCFAEAFHRYHGILPSTVVRGIR